ncbi:MAG: thiamine ABC transporter substrate-binding protein [Rhodoluna sp.]|jgi:thiamine transport system substrate-binding protein|nr:thiamine ABC transporter substrate-binding protein [Rhodoluna sp.]
MKRIFAFTLTLLTIFGLSSCSPSPKTLTLIAHDSFVMSDDLITAFEETYKVELKIVRAGDAGAMTNKLVLTKDNPLADVVFGIDNTFAPVATKNNLIDGELTPIDFADVSFNYDLEYFKTNNLAAPKSWRDLIKTEYKGLTVIENPNTSSTGLAFLVSTYAGFPTKTFDSATPTVTWWLALRDNDVKVAASWEDAYYTDFSGSSGKGKYPIVLSYSSSPADEVNEDGTARTKALLEDSFRQTEYVGVLKNANNPQGARDLIKFMLGQNFQSELPGAMYVYPIDKSVALPPRWAVYAPAATSTIGENLDIDTNRDKWLADYNRVFDVAP